jgi:uncharacterized repeat protein (TIGR01451 family)
MHAPGSHLYRYLLLALTLICIVGLALPARIQAVDIAPPTSPAFLQTSGARTSLGTGDFYTNVNGANNTLGHTVEVLVPCTWPAATPITFAIFDPEINVPNQLTPPIVDDEIRDNANAELANPTPAQINANADNTRFTLIAPGGATVGPVSFTPNGGTNLLWVELATFRTSQAGYGCGSYRVRTTTGNGGSGSLTFDNDDNAWRLRVVNDPDCTVTPGTCSGIGATQSGRIGDTNGVDNLDGVAGTGDELLIGMIDASFQHTAPAASSCLDLYEFVDGLVSPVRFNNFDMDESNSPADISVTYFPPSTSNYAPSVEGVTSENADWNPPPADGPPPTRSGDAFVVDADDVGWWRIRTCVQNDNQYIVEGQLGVPAYFSQPPTPRMVLTKTNGETTVQNGQVLTYTMTFTNTSNLAPPTPTTPGPAVNTVLTDQLPADLTFISCSLVAPLAGTCSHNGVNPGGVVTFNITTMFKPGEGGQLRVRAQVNNSDGDPLNVITNRATLTYRDPLNNPYPPVVAQVSNPTAITLASFSARWMGSAVRVNWRTGSEDKTLGFHLLRATSPDLDQATQVTSALTPARGAGSSYGWTDQAAAPGAIYYYWLQEREIDGATNTYGPTSTVGTGSAAVYQQFLPFVTR